MLGQGRNIDKLARYRRQWEKFLAASKASGATAEAGASQTTALSERTGFGSNPGNLRMLSYVPENLPANSPLVVVLHGCTQTAGGYDRGTGWSTLAERHGFALLLPEQRRANNPNTCFNWFSVEDTGRGRGEALSIRQMIEHMVQVHGIDRSRIYITGLSAGGAMTSVMLATYPEVFAGGAIIAGLPYGSAANVQEAFGAMFEATPHPARALGDRVRAASSHTGPWPKLSLWHGSADQTVKPANADEIVKQWADVHGLSTTPSSEMNVDGHLRRVWRNEQGDAVIEAYTIAGMAHGAPIGAGCGQAGPFIIDAGISSTMRISEFWQLFSAQPADAAAPDWNGRRKPQATSTRASGTVIDQEGRVLDDAPDGAAKPADSGDAAENGVGSSRFDPGPVIRKALRSAGLMK